MTRYPLPLIVALAVLALLAACTLTPAAAPTNAPARVAQDAPEREVVALLYSDGSWATVTPVPAATPTHTPTATATHTPTNTPDVVASTTPEDFRTPSNTPPPTWTPTATVTPSPSPSPTPDADACYGTTLVNLNLRDDYPRTESDPPGNVIGSWKAGERLVISDQYLVFFQSDPLRVDYWYEVMSLDGKRRGWSASIYNKVRYIDVEPTQICLDLFGTDLPVRQGFQLIGTDEGGRFAGDYCADMDTVKLFGAAMQLATFFRLCNPDIFIVCRFWTDDIFIDSDFDAWVVYERIGRNFPNECDMVEAENEHAPQQDEDWPKWVKASINFAALMAQNRNMQYCAASLGPGWPELYQMGYWLDYFLWVAAHPLSDGRYHGFCTHAAPFATYSRIDWQWVNNWFIAGRIFLIRDYLYRETGFDLVTWPGEWVISEVGLSDGYSGSWTAPYDCNDVADAFWQTQLVHVLHQIVTAFEWWNIDDANGAWSDDSACGWVIYG